MVISFYTNSSICYTVSVPRIFTNPGPIHFTGIIKTDKKNSSAWLYFPYDLKETYGVGNLVPFIATFDNHVTYRGSLAKMGGDCAMVLLRKDVFAKIGKKKGETVEVVITLDDTPRKLPIAKDLQKVLQEGNVWEQFSTLSFTHRKEYIEWIESAKKADTRQKRLGKIVSMLKNNIKTPY
jgi:hypothetical protein